MNLTPYFTLYNATLFVAIFMMGWACRRAYLVLRLYRHIKAYFDGDKAVFWGKGAMLGMTILFALRVMAHCPQSSTLNVITSVVYICLIRMDRHLSRIILERIRVGMFPDDKDKMNY